MADSNRRDFLKKGAKAALGVGALGALSGGLAAGCDVETSTEVAAATYTNGLTYKLHEDKYRQLSSFPDVLKEFTAALDEVTEGLMSDPSAYAGFIENSDAIGTLQVWEANAEMLVKLVGEVDGTTKRGRLKRMLTVSELFDGASDGKGPGFLDNSLVASSSSSSSSSSSISSGGDCATNGSATNGCCVIHTWGWSAGEGRCSGIAQAPQDLPAQDLPVPSLP